MSKIYTYHGNYYTHLYHNFTIEIEAESTEEANAKVEAYLKDQANHEEIIKSAETNEDRFWMSDHRRYFEENAEIDSGFVDLEDDTEDIDISISLNN